MRAWLAVRTSSHESEVANTVPTHSSSPLAQHSVQPVQANPNLSLCVTSLMLDLAQGPEYDVSWLVMIPVLKEVNIMGILITAP